MLRILHDTRNDQSVGDKRTMTIAGKWIVSLVGLLTICLIVIFANYEQKLNASSLAITQSEPIQPIVRAQTQNIETMARTTDQQAAKPSIWPVSGEVTSGFGWRNSPWGGGRELHAGIDIANSMSTPIVATADGQVVKSEMAGGYGNIVQIDHGNGIETLYGHNSRLLVTVGQSVKKGQVIAYLGSTGRSTGPHVHYEVRVNGTAVDPISFMVLY